MVCILSLGTCCLHAQAAMDSVHGKKRFCILASPSPFHSGKPVFLQHDRMTQKSNKEIWKSQTHGYYGRQKSKGESKGIKQNFVRLAHFFLQADDEQWKRDGEGQPWHPKLNFPIASPCQLTSQTSWPNQEKKHWQGNKWKKKREKNHGRKKKVKAKKWTREGNSDKQNGSNLPVLTCAQ